MEYGIVEDPFNSTEDQYHIDLKLTAEFDAIDQILLCSAYDFCLHVELV